MISYKKIFIKNILVLIAFLCLIVFVYFYTLINNNITILKVGLAIFAFILLFFIILIIWGTLILYKGLNNKKINKINVKLCSWILPITYPVLKLLYKSFNDDMSAVMRAYIKINNSKVRSMRYNLKSNELLILLPHCIQNSKCVHKITNNIENCARCGKCDVKDILLLKEKYHLNIAVATGGTLARKWVEKFKPKAIVAVACERDLLSGIRDVKGIPVLGIFNYRPNGPCFDTKVDIIKLEEAIKFYMGVEN